MSLGDIFNIFCSLLCCCFDRYDLSFRDKSRSVVQGAGGPGLLLDDIKLEVEEPPGESSEG